MIRVLQMIGNLGMGGSQTMVINLLKNIDRDKVMFDFIVDHPKLNYYESEVISLGSKIYCMPSFNGTNLISIKRKWNTFFAEHPEYRILHSHVRSYASIYIPIAKKHGVKTIIHSHSTSNGKGLIAAAKYVLQIPLKYQVDYLMACSTESAIWLYGKKYNKRGNYFFLPNAIDVDDFVFNQSFAKKTRNELGINDEFVVGHIGRFHESKNHMFLLDVFYEILNERPNSKLLLIGDGELRPDIEKKISKLGIKNNVILLGNNSKVSNLIQAMDVFAFPSKWEGLPIAVVEAQAAGLPCVISNNITSDVDISNLITRLPIDDHTLWASEILKLDISQRENLSVIIKDAGFDIHDTSSKLSNFYCSILK